MSKEKIKEKSPKKIANGTFSPAFSKGKSSSLKDVETEYIKNLQKQIYFLELETEFLRSQAKQATDIQPRITKEADKMMFKIKDMQVDIDGMKLEITRKDATISMLKNEKHRATNELCSLDESTRREKNLLTEDVIQLKKMKEVADLDIARKDGEIVGLQQQLEQTLADFRHEKHAKNLLQAQLDQRINQHNQTSLLLEEKRQEVLHKQTQMHYLEEKYSKGTLAIQEKITRDLKDELQSLRGQLRQAEFQAEQDRIVKEKVVENVSKITQENISLQTQVLDLSRQIDHESLIRNERDAQAQKHSSQIARLRGQEEVLSLESKKFQELLENERQKYLTLEAQLMKSQDTLTTRDYRTKTLESRTEELEARFARIDEDNVQLRRDKVLLTEHIAQLQKQLEVKQKEVLQMENHMQTLQGDVSTLKSEIQLAKSTHSENWSRLSKAAGTIEVSPRNKY